jgi:hypothetical protein
MKGNKHDAVKRHHKLVTAYDTGTLGNTIDGCVSYTAASARLTKTGCFVRFVDATAAALARLSMCARSRYTPYRTRTRRSVVRRPHTLPVTQRKSHADNTTTNSHATASFPLYTNTQPRQLHQEILSRIGYK